MSADTLVYFGALEAFAAAAAGALRPGGLLVFTVEEEVEAAFAQSYRIRPHGRYTHGADYVRQLLVSVGLEPAHRTRGSAHGGRSARGRPGRRGP